MERPRTLWLSLVLEGAKNSEGCGMLKGIETFCVVTIIERKNG
jgi:hypothetical protein